ncbi:uroporphyrinogen-III synthase [Marinobacter sp. HL-58]|uniref:uroporphyrinogen-III synthase n=1 Tax=Marinobacter sp. HL-58 TaxID=1479237 RepID=UPI0004841587|nr:uroporphyrinogen-III synthase [Marinobacter sp. HL-58]KPP99303.1 MAG: uroporphyrinogen-III synthase HemD [Marinobacter sp. HL-58]
MATPRPDSLPLEDRRILICRPQPEADRLAGSFRNAGAVVQVLPLIAREPLPEDPATRTIILNLDEYSHVIAVSPYAASLLLEWLDTWWPQVPSGVHWYGVGAGTAAVLAGYGLNTRQPESGHSSEDLLQLPELSTLNHEKVLVVRGQEGRELIPQTLEQRGARVTVLPLYRRYCPDYDETTLKAMLNDFSPEVIVTLSGETLNNLIALSENTGHNLEETLLVVPVERIAQQARLAGLRRTCIPGSLADSTIVAAVAEQLASPDGGSGNTK